MTVKNLLILTLYSLTTQILIKTPQTLLPLSRQLSLLSLDQKTTIQKKLRLCGNSEKCRKKTLFAGLELIFNKPSKRALQIKSMNIMHILFIIIFIFLMFNSNLSASLFLSGLLIWSLVNLLHHGGHMRKLKLGEKEMIFRKFGKNHFRKLFVKERGRLFHFFEGKKVKGRRLNRGMLKDLTMEYFDVVHGKRGAGLAKTVEDFVGILFRNRKSVMNKILDFSR